MKPGTSCPTIRRRLSKMEGREVKSNRVVNFDPWSVAWKDMDDDGNPLVYIAATREWLTVDKEEIPNLLRWHEDGPNEGD